MLVQQLKEAQNQYRSLKNQAKDIKENLNNAKNNIKSLDVEKLKKLKDALKEMRKNVKGIAEIQEELSQLDKEYNENFSSPGGGVRPSEEENRKTQTRIQQTLRANQKSIDSLSVLQTYAKDIDDLDDIIDKSNNAEGIVQATQSTNNMLALMAKNEHEMKLLLGRDLEQRTLAMSQEQLDKDWSYQQNKQFWESSSSKSSKSKMKLPKLKSRRIS